MTLILNVKFAICTYMRTNVLAERFKRCSINVKISLFRAYCIYACILFLYGHFIMLAL